MVEISTTYQGQLRCTAVHGPSGNSLTTEGPVSVGSMTINANTFSFKPLPVITNMPVGAPVPPNVSATISPLYQYP